MSKRTPLSIKEFGELFKLLVSISEYDITEVCNRSDINTAYPSRWRKGHGKKPDYHQIGLLSQVLEVPVETLVFGFSETVTISSEEYQENKNARELMLYTIAQQKAQRDNNDKPENRTN